MKVHTQEEVAVILRKSVATIYRLRMAGEIAFIPGRDVTIFSKRRFLSVWRGSAATVH